ncbi:MAG: HAD family phosphatase [Trueperaceae bacterium]|nr:HAD family phosphatase [Trueperaceae bacterium]
MLPLVILDLDGTIIGKSGQVEACIWDIVERAKDKGMRFSVCTGRPNLGVARRVAERLGPNNPHIFQNGAHIALSSGDSIEISGLKSSATLELINFARTKGLVLELYTPNTLYVERRTPISEAHAKMIGVQAIVKDLEEVLATEPIIRAQWVIPTEALELALSAKPSGTQHGVATASAQPGTYFVSITKEGVSKGSAVGTLCKHLKLDKDQAMGIGDSVGDIPMLEAVAHPRVMANSPQELLDVYPSTPDDVDNCGAVDAIQEALEFADTSSD